MELMNVLFYSFTTSYTKIEKKFNFIFLFLNKCDNNLFMQNVIFLILFF
jgi:hypothetical protein